MDWSSESLTVVTLLVLVLVLGFLWDLNRDVRGLDRDLRGLSDRVARVEGLLEGLRDSIASRADHAAPR